MDPNPGEVSFWVRKGGSCAGRFRNWVTFQYKTTTKPPRIDVCNVAFFFPRVMFVFVLLLFFCFQSMLALFLQALMDDEQAEEFGTQDFKAKLP